MHWPKPRGCATRFTNSCCTSDPEYRAYLPNLQTERGLKAIEVYRATGARALDQERAAAVRRLAARVRLALQQANDLERQIGEQVAPRFSPLTKLCSIKGLTAGALAGILEPGRRFATEAQLAAYAGVAPLRASSAGGNRHRLNRGGNRRLNAILYRIALTQAWHLPAARTYLDRRKPKERARPKLFGHSNASSRGRSGGCGRSASLHHRAAAPTAATA